MSADRWLDEAAKTLASARSRRDVLRGVTAAFASALIAAIVPTPAQANSECVDRSKDAGLTGRELGECIAGCARGGIPCGDALCDPATEFCCNESCSICAPNGETCVQVICS